MTSSKETRLTRWFGRRPLRTVLRLGAIALGVGATGWLLSVLWPEPDRAAKEASTKSEAMTNLAPFPSAPVMVLVVGIDANQLGESSNQAAPLGRANADALLLLRVSAEEPLQVLQLPSEIAVQLPGSDSPTSLSSLWQRGGVALLNDAIQDILGSTQQVPQRYVVMPRSALRSLVDGLGDVDLVLDQTYQHNDQSQGYSINLQAGRQRLNGEKAEQFARYRPTPLDNANRRNRQQDLILALVDQVKDSSVISTLPLLVSRLDDELDTNLSRREQLSLAAALIASPLPVRITQVPLAERMDNQILRQVKPDQTLPLWPQD
ncbi:cell envelope-related transcriptional attenuator [Synechococcus sp. CC9902]|uniref:LCP family protein n=1 Tax=Synechococcus sp. (strain CC9902) TaxID=316279 RepID=UPI00005D41E5|nr:LCP family protein [Synechococcus sp. CC9902]ABB26337.1 cell envelope-related transcriptional attenuator [Synechococcus sp. CC9902]